MYTVKGGRLGGGRGGRQTGISYFLHIYPIIYTRFSPTHQYTGRPLREPGGETLLRE